MLSGRGSSCGRALRRALRKADAGLTGGCPRLLLLSAAAGAIATPALAALPSASVFVPSQPMSAALQALSRQTGTNILFLPGSVRGLRSNLVAGRFDALEAVNRMVAGTPLQVSQDALGGLVVRPGPAPRPAQPAVVAPPAREAPSARPAAPAPAPAEPSVLREVVVTATRQPNILNRVPLSVSAQTQASMDQRGLRTLQDLESATPALRITEASGVGTAILAIRGVVHLGPTAATTGFYLDDTPLQRRSTGGAGGVNGTPQPVLFDLERVEVLRGPQGTLFGSGAEGGVLRLIQPKPGLTTYTAYARAQVSATHYGGLSHEIGAAVGGPLIEGRLGFRAAAFTRDTAGYIDLVSPLNSQVWLKDANDARQSSVRLAVTWAPTDRLKATVSLVTSRTRGRHELDRVTLPTTDPIVVPTLCYDTRRIETLPPKAVERETPRPIGRGEAECAAARAAGRVTHQTPGYSLGPFALKPFEAIESDASATASRLTVLSFDTEAEFDGFGVKSLVSYVEDSPEQRSPQPFQVDRTAVSANFDPSDPRNARIGGIVIPVGVPAVPFLGPEGFRGPAYITSVNPRYSFTHELRISSAPQARPVSWLAGAFYSNARIKPSTTIVADSDAYARALFGISEVQRYGLASLESAPGRRDVFARIRQSLKDEETAVFGEVNYHAGPWTLIAGLRVTWMRFSYSHAEIGPSNGLAVATVENGGAYGGHVAETPVTPRLGVQYALGPDKTLYATASKGYRAGGINTPIASAQAGDSLARTFGADFTVFDLPRTYASDYVWSYEAGAKLRLSRGFQLNAAAYLIDWRDPQTSTPIPQAGAVVTTNARQARSVGAEIEAQLAAGPLSATAALGLSRAKYTRRSVAFTGSNGVEAVSTLEGQGIAGPPATLSLSARYDLGRLAGAPTYVRGDWRYSAAFDVAGFGSTGWNPDANRVPSLSIVNLRAGLELPAVDVSLFVNNLFEPDGGPASGGRAGCLLPAAGGTPACSVYAAYEPFRRVSRGRPREIGVQIVYRR